MLGPGAARVPQVRGCKLLPIPACPVHPEHPRGLDSTLLTSQLACPLTGPGPWPCWPTFLTLCSAEQERNRRHDGDVSGEEHPVHKAVGSFISCLFWGYKQLKPVIVLIAPCTPWIYLYDLLQTLALHLLSHLLGP